MRKKILLKKISPKFLFIVLNGLLKFRPKRISDTKIRLYELWSPNDKKELESFLAIDCDKTINTNKKKALLVEATYSVENNNFNIEIFQKKARGVIVTTEVDISEIENYELSSYLNSFKENFSNRKVAMKNKSSINDLHNCLLQILILDEESLEDYSRATNFDSNSIALKQVKFSYLYYTKQIDNYAERIDSFKEEVSVKAENKKLKRMINMCEDIAEKFSIDLDCINDFC